MKLNRLFLWIPLALLLVLGVLAAWLFTADLGVFKAQIEQIVSEKLEREFAIEGELHIELGNSIDISATHLRLANPDWAESPNLLVLDSVVVSVDLLSLLEGPVIVENLVLAGGMVHAEVSDEGRGSWLIGPPQVVQAKAVASDTAVLFLRLDFQDFRGSLLRPGGEPPIEMELASFQQQHLADDMLKINVRGLLGDQAVEYQGLVGPFSNLVNGQDVTGQGEGRFGSLQISGKAYVDFLGAPQYPSFELTLEGPEVKDITDMLKLESSMTGPYLVNAKAERAGTSLLATVNARVGETEFALEGTSGSISDFSHVDYTVEGHGPDLGALTSLFGAGHWPDEPWDMRAALQRRGPSLMLDNVLFNVGGTRFDLDGALSSFPNLHDSDVQLNIAGPDVARFRELLGFEGIAEGAFKIGLVLEAVSDGPDRVQAELETALGQVNATGKMGDGPTYAGSVLELTALLHDTRAVMSGFGIEGFPAEPINLSANFEVQEGGLKFEQAALVTLLDDRLEIEGFVGFDPLHQDTDIKFRLSGDDIAQVAAMSGKDLPLPQQPYEFEGGFRVTDAGYSVDSLNGAIGPNLLVFDGLITRAADFAGTDFTFGLEGPDLETLLKDTAGFDVPAHEFQLNGHLRHLQDELHLENLEAHVGGLQAEAALQFRLPFDASSGRFTVDVSGPDINVVLPEFEHIRPAHEPFDLRLKGQLHQGAWTFEQAELKIADARLSLQGVFDQLPDFSSTNIDFELTIPKTGSLGTQKNGDPLPRKPASVKAHFSGTTELFRLDELAVQYGGTDIAGSMVADFSGDVPGVSLTSASRQIDLGEWFGEEEEDTEASARASDGRRIPDLLFPFEKLASVNAEVDISAGRLLTKNAVIENFVFDALLSNGALSVRSISGEGIDGNFNGSASLVPRGNGQADLAMKWAINGLKLDLSRDDVDDDTNLPVINFEMDVGGFGAGLREATGHLNGHISADSSKGVIPNSALSVLDKGLMEQIFGAILPKTEESETTYLECFAARLNIQDGLVEAAPGVAIVTDKVQMVSAGKLDLKTEKLDLTFQTHATKAYQANVSEVLINPFVKISGTLAEPQLTLDAGRALLYTGAAIGTAGLSILAKGLLDRMTNASDPCAKFMEEGRK